jgi:hypothetical protein
MAILILECEVWEEKQGEKLNYIHWYEWGGRGGGVSLDYLQI